MKLKWIAPGLALLLFCTACKIPDIILPDAPGGWSAAEGADVTEQRPPVLNIPARQEDESPPEETGGESPPEPESAAEPVPESTAESRAEASGQPGLLSSFETAPVLSAEQLPDSYNGLELPVRGATGYACVRLTMWRDPEDCAAARRAVAEWERKAAERRKAEEAQRQAELQKQAAQAPAEPVLQPEAAPQQQNAPAVPPALRGAELPRIALLAGEAAAPPEAVPQPAEGASPENGTETEPQAPEAQPSESPVSPEPSPAESAPQPADAPESVPQPADTPESVPESANAPEPAPQETPAAEPPAAPAEQEAPPLPVESPLPMESPMEPTPESVPEPVPESLPEPAPEPTAEPAAPAVPAEPLGPAPSATAGSLAALPAGTAFTILTERDEWWQIQCTADYQEDGETRHGEIIGWVEHRNCMINLPDVIPSIIYDATNGYSSKFVSCGRPLPGITGEALYTGRITNNRLGRKEFMMPVLYAMAPRLCAAQRAALAEGNSLILYEGYRPLETQLAVSQTLREVMNQDPEVKAAVTTQPWGISWFIATGASNHQHGYAVDVSLARIGSAEEFHTGDCRYIKIQNYDLYQMPTVIHELSRAAATFTTPVASNSLTAWKSAQLAPSMNAAAIGLQGYCTGAALTPLASEWWHFNDLAARTSVLGNLGKGDFEIRVCRSTAP